MSNTYHTLPLARLSQVVLAVYWLAILIGTHVPSEFRGMPTDMADKPIHFGAFAALAVLLAATWQLSAGRLGTSHLRWAWLLLLFYAAVDELTQPYFGRTGDLGDWLADMVGAAAGLAAFAWWNRRRSQPEMSDETSDPHAQ